MLCTEQMVNQPLQRPAECESARLDSQWQNLEHTYTLQNVKAVHDLTKYHVLAIQLRKSFGKGDVELGSIGVFATVGHPHNSQLVVL